MKDERIGEALWSAWDGEEYEEQLLDPYVYQTEGHVDLDIDVVRVGLASTLQRDGIVFSLKKGLDLLENSVVSHTWGGIVDGEWYRVIVDYDTGLSVDSQEPTEDIVELTIVEIPAGDS